MNCFLCKSCGEACDEEDENWTFSFVERVCGGWKEEAVDLALAVLRTFIRCLRICVGETVLMLSPQR